MLRLVERSDYPPVTLEEVAEHVRRDTTDDDDLLEQYVKAATLWVENFTGLALVDQTWDYYFDDFPGDITGIYSGWNSYITIPRPPLLEVIGVWGRDTTEIAFTGYSVDDASMPARIYLPSTGSWPNTDGAPNAGRIRYRAGYIETHGSPWVDTEVPQDIKTAICIYTADLYENRESRMPAALSTRLPWGAEAILRNYRVETSIS